MTISEVQDNIIEEFSLFDDWMDKYSLLIDLGKELPVIDPKYKVKDFLIEGCQSKVWLYPEFDGKLISFTEIGRASCRERVLHTV
jgi:cysteine desulfuration protein SufE